MKFKDFGGTALAWYNRKLAIRRLKKHNLYMLEMELLLEDFLTKNLLDEDLTPQEKVSERNELLKKQYSIKKIEMFLDYLSKIS